MNVAIIGLGNIGYYYDRNFENKYFSLSKSFNASSFFNFTVAIEINKKVRDDFKKRYPHIKVYENISILKEKKIDLVVISTPTSKHYECLKKVIDLKNIKSILIEKPISNKNYEFKKIIKKFNENKKTGFINYQRQSHPAFLDLKNKLKSSKKTSIEIKYSKGIYNNASHFLNYILSIYGNKFKIIKTFDKKKFNDDYLINFDLNFKDCVTKFRYTKNLNCIKCINKKIVFIHSKNKFIYTLNGKQKFKNKEVKKMSDNYQYHVIKNLERYFKKKKSYLCFLNKYYKTEDVISDIINHKNV